MTKIIIGVSAFALMLVLPFVSQASTYQYVNTQGNVQTMTAASSADALSQPSNIGVNSGVMLVSGNQEATYMYVNTQGSLQTVTASNPEQALTVSSIGINSGVMVAFLFTKAGYNTIIN